MANPFTDYRDSLLTRYDMAGYSTTIDPSTVNPPGVVVGPIESITPVGNTNWDIESSVWLVHPSPGGVTAFDWLEGNLPTFLSYLPPFDSVELTTYPHPSGDLPAYRASIRTTIPEA